MDSFYETDCEGIGREFLAGVLPELKIGDTYGFGAGGELLAEYLGNNKWKTIGINEDYTNPNYKPRKPYVYHEKEN